MISTVFVGNVSITESKIRFIVVTTTSKESLSLFKLFTLAQILKVAHKLLKMVKVSFLKQKVTRIYESCSKSVKLPKTYRATCGKGYIRLRHSDRNIYSTYLRCRGKSVTMATNVNLSNSVM